MRKSRLAGQIKRFVKWHVASRTFPLGELDAYAAENGLQVNTIMRGSTVRSNPPKFWGGSDKIDLSIYAGTLIAPEVKLIEIPNAVAVGRSEFIIKDGRALYPRPFDPDLYTFMLELEKRARVDLSQSRITLQLKSKVIKVGRAISLLGQCNGNYAHWVLEVLTRAAIVETIPSLQGLPFLVDSPVHETLGLALEFLNKSGREIIPVRNAQKVEAEKVFHLTSPSFTPPETRRFFESGEIDKPRPDQFRFSPDALRVLREMALQEVAEYAPRQNFHQHMKRDLLVDPQLVYMPRKPATTGNGRHIANATAVEADLLSRGFSMVDTFSMSFEEQVLSLRSAKVVVSAIGSSLVNLVFCEPGVKVVMLSPHYPDANWFYWANLMTAMGHNIYIVLGPQCGSGASQIYHRDFRISLRLLDAALGEALKEARVDESVRPSLYL